MSESIESPGEFPESVVVKVANHVSVCEERAGLLNGSTTAWRDTEGDLLSDEVPDGEDIVWVQSSAVRDALHELEKETSDIGALSRMLQEEGYTNGPSERVSCDGPDGDAAEQWNCFPFDSASLCLPDKDQQHGHPESDVVLLDADAVDDVFDHLEDAMEASKVMLSHDEVRPSSMKAAESAQDAYTSFVEAHPDYDLTVDGDSDE